MSPKEYIKARENNVERSIIDGQPYLPFLSIDTTTTSSTSNDNNDQTMKMESAKRVVIEMLFGGNNNNNDASAVAAGGGGGAGGNADDTDKLNVEEIHGGITNELFCCSGIHDLQHYHQHLQIKPIENGGNTNELLVVSGIGDPSSTKSQDTNNSTLVNSIPNKILIRIFGGIGMIDRDVENSTFAAIALSGNGPKYYGRFQNGRLEEYYDNIHTLEVKELGSPEISKSIAIEMGKFHSTFTIPKYLEEYHNIEQPSMWTQLYSWYEQATDTSSEAEADDLEAKRRTTILADEELNVKQYYNELKWLQNDIVPPDSKIGFCNNDLLAANILLDKNATIPKIYLIDFEYGGMNYLCFDIANHFNEYAGGTSIEENSTPNYELFPSYQQQYDFIKQYLISYNKHSKNDNDGRVPSEEEIQMKLKEVSSFLLVNHLYWALWAVNQAATEGSPTELNDPTIFNYLHYAKCRFNQYWIEKKEMMKQ